MEGVEKGVNEELRLEYNRGKGGGGGRHLDNDLGIHLLE